MENRLIAIYKRPDTYRGHSKINHYHIPVELRCYVLDYSDSRERGELVNGRPLPDRFVVETVNHKGEVIHRYNFGDRESANVCVRALWQNLEGFEKVDLA